MRIETKLREVLETLMNSMHEKRKLILALSCVVVFMTTYEILINSMENIGEKHSISGTYTGIIDA